MKRGYILPLVILFAIIAVLALPSLLKREKETIDIDDVEFTFTKDALYKERVFLCDKGTIRLDSQKRLMYTSFDMKSSIVLCNMVDCNHDNSNCPAWFGDELVNVIYYYKDKQYIISEKNNVQYDKLDLYEANADGTNRQKIYDFDYYNYEQYWGENGMLYMFVTDVGDSSVSDGNGGYNEVPQSIRLITYNFESGETKELIKFEESYQNDYQVLGIYDNKIYFRFQRSLKPYEELYDDNGNSISGSSNGVYSTGIACIDINGNGSMEVICQDEAIEIVGLDAGKLYWYTYEYNEELNGKPYEIKVYDINNQNTEIIKIGSYNYSYVIKIVDGKIYFKSDQITSMVYDLSSGEINKYKLDKFVVGVYNDYYLLSDSDIWDSFRHVVKKDSLADKGEYIEIWD